MATNKQAATKLSKRAASAAALTRLLASLPKIDPSVIPSAVESLMDAAENYMASKPLVDPKGRRSLPSIANARARIASIHSHLAKAHQEMSDLPLDAITAVVQATGAPLGKMRFDIEQVQQAVENALADLAARPNKVADAARNVLAYQVAVVFRDILKMKPTSTSDKQLTANMTTARGGAAYARVLRATLKAAGVVNYDPGPLIAAGLALLKDPALPS